MHSRALASLPPDQLPEVLHRQIAQSLSALNVLNVLRCDNQLILQQKRRSAKAQKHTRESLPVSQKKKSSETRCPGGAQKWQRPRQA